MGTSNIKHTVTFSQKKILTLSVTCTNEELTLEASVRNDLSTIGKIKYINTFKLNDFHDIGNSYFADYSNLITLCQELVKYLIPENLSLDIDNCVNDTIVIVLYLEGNNKVKFLLERVNNKTYNQFSDVYLKIGQVNTSLSMIQKALDGIKK